MDMFGNYQREVEVALAAVQDASKLAQSNISSRDGAPIIEKDDLSPVTVSDFAVQALLTATIRHEFPEDRFVGEENASALREDPALMERVWDLLKCMKDMFVEDLHMLPVTKSKMCDLIDLCGATSPGGPGQGRTWIFDPIDGTKSYMKGGLYAINIGFLVDGKQQVGVVGAPNMPLGVVKPPPSNELLPSTGQGCVFLAIRGHGSFVRPIDWHPYERDMKPPLPRGVLGYRLPQLPPEAVPTDSSSSTIRLVTCTTVDSALPGIHEAIATRLNATYPSCDLESWVLRWAMLALGTGDATAWVYKRVDRRAKVWDHAGATLLFEEAGGRVTDVRGRDIDMAAGRTLVGNVGFVAARGEAMHRRVLEAVQGELRERGLMEYLEG